MPSRLRNPSMVATVHWPTKASWKRAAPCNKTNFEAPHPLRCHLYDPPPTNKSVAHLILAWILVFFYKAVNNSVFIDSEALPVSRQFTRSTYRRSFFIRVCRTWNVLPVELRSNHSSLKSLLLQYYKKALTLYDVDDIRTWRAICPRCNTARSLLCPPTCYF